MITKQTRAKLFKTLRELNDLSVSKVARDTHTTRDTVRDMESATHNPWESTLTLFFDYYAKRDHRIKEIQKTLRSIARVGAGNGGSRGLRGRG